VGFDFAGTQFGSTAANDAADTSPMWRHVSAVGLRWKPVPKCTATPKIVHVQKSSHQSSKSLDTPPPTGPRPLRTGLRRCSLMGRSLVLGTGSYKAPDTWYIHAMQTCACACPALEDAALRLSCGLTMSFGAMSCAFRPLDYTTSGSCSKQQHMPPRGDTSNVFAWHGTNAWEQYRGVPDTSREGRCTS
jgi:hypothetical protein